MSMQGEGTRPAGQLLVWDTSPLHHAIKAGRVDTLADLAAEGGGLPRRNVTTAAVIEELRHYDLDVSGLGWLEIQHVDGLAELTALVRWMERNSSEYPGVGRSPSVAPRPSSPSPLHPMPDPPDTIEGRPHATHRGGRCFRGSARCRPSPVVPVDGGTRRAARWT
ncbi:hypothetical protein STREPTOSP366_18140 [Streptomyces variabilis]